MLIPPGFAQVNFKLGGAAAGVGAEMTLGLDVTGNTDPLSVQAETLEGIFATNILPQLVSQISLVGVLLKHGPNETGPSVEAGTLANGSNETQALPALCAVIVRKNTELGGRKGRGRFFVPGVPESEVDGAGHVASANTTAITTAFNSFRDALEAAELPPVLLHNDDTVPTPIVSFSAITLVGTQRRRGGR